MIKFLKFILILLVIDGTDETRKDLITFYLQGHITERQYDILDEINFQKWRKIRYGQD